jgi:hypothetical protein
LDEKNINKAVVVAIPMSLITHNSQAHDSQSLSPLLVLNLPLKKSWDETFS